MSTRSPRKTIALQGAPLRLKVLDESDDHPGGMLEGHASVFDNIDLHGDVIRRGAFKRTLRERKGQILLFDSHGFHEGTEAVIGKVLEAKEDETGLFFRAYFSQTERAQRVRQKIREGTLDALSIGFSIRDRKLTEIGSGKDRRIIQEILEVELFEVSVVAFGANPAARIADAKAARGPLSIDGFVQQVRNAAGGSSAVAPTFKDFGGFVQAMRGASRPLGRRSSS